MKTILSNQLQQQMYTHLCEAYPNEGGGLLVGEVTTSTVTVSHVMPAENTFPTEDQFHRMGLAPTFWMQVEDYADQVGLQVVGFYHSHPDHPSRPSEYDLKYALSNLVYIIVSVVIGQVDTITSWQLAEGRSKFNPHSLVIN